jgi:hypothetical protein
MTDPLVRTIFTKFVRPATSGLGVVVEGNKKVLPAVQDKLHAMSLPYQGTSQAASEMGNVLRIKSFPRLPGDPKYIPVTYKLQGTAASDVGS